MDSKIRSSKSNSKVVSCKFIPLRVKGCLITTQPSCKRQRYININIFNTIYIYCIIGLLFYYKTFHMFRTRKYMFGTKGWHKGLMIQIKSSSDNFTIKRSISSLILIMLTIFNIYIYLGSPQQPRHKLRAQQTSWDQNQHLQTHFHVYKLSSIFQFCSCT